MSIIKKVTFELSTTEGVPTCHYTIEWPTGNTSMGIANRDLVMQLTSQFFPADVQAFALYVKAASSINSPSTSTSTSASSSTSTPTSAADVAVTIPLATVKAGI